MGLRPAAAPVRSLSSPPERPRLPRSLASPRLNPPWPLGWHTTGKLCVPSLLRGLGGKGSRSCEQSGERRPLSENIELPPGCWARVPALPAPAEIQIASGGGLQLSTSVKMTLAGTGPSSPEGRLCQGAGRPPGEAPRRGAESDHTGHPKALAAGLASTPRAGRRPPGLPSPPRDPVRAAVVGPVPGTAPGTDSGGLGPRPRGTAGRGGRREAGREVSPGVCVLGQRGREPGRPSQQEAGTQSSKEEAAGRAVTPGREGARRRLGVLGLACGPHACPRGSWNILAGGRGPRCVHPEVGGWAPGAITGGAHTLSHL